MQTKLKGVVLALTILAPLGAHSQETEPAATATPAAAAAATETGTVVFFREKKFAGSAVRYKVRENGVEVCKLKSGTFCSIQVPVGKHEYVVHSEAKDVLTLEVESGETYYVIGAISMGFLAGRPNLSPSDKGKFEGMKAKLKDNTGQDLNSDDKDEDEEEEAKK
jgi:hypothetical protein